MSLTDTGGKFFRCPDSFGLTVAVWFADQLETLAALYHSSASVGVAFRCYPTVGDIAWFSAGSGWKYEFV